MKRTKQAAPPTPPVKQKMPWKSSKKGPKLTTYKQRTKRMNKLTGAKDNPAYSDLLNSQRFWEAKSTFGRNPTFKTPEDLAKACTQYFVWVEEHPFYEFKVVGTSFGEPITENIPKKRPMTQVSLCLFLDISQVSWLEYRKKSPEFLRVVDMAMEVIKEQKFGGAAAGFFNTNIICRDLGLVDKKDVTSAGQAIQGNTTIINKIDLSGLTTVELKSLEGLATKLFEFNKEETEFEEEERN